MMSGYFYILTNKRKTLLYTGATKNLKKRVDLHVSGKGALFTKKYTVHTLVYFEKFDNISDAFKREKQIKNWHKEWKWNLIKSKNPELIDLYLKIDSVNPYEGC